MFPNSTVTHLPISSSDHCGLWLRLSLVFVNQSRNYFKFLSPWIEHEDFENQVSTSWVPSDDWNVNISRMTTNLKHWNKHVFGNIFKRKERILRRLEGINNKLMLEDNDRLVRLRCDLWKEYNSVANRKSYTGFIRKNISGYLKETTILVFPPILSHQEEEKSYCCSCRYCRRLDL